MNQKSVIFCILFFHSLCSSAAGSFKILPRPARHDAEAGPVGGGTSAAAEDSRGRRQGTAFLTARARGEERENEKKMKKKKEK